jgi:GNAT superfamily N-acetyltransferase
MQIHCRPIQETDAARAAELINLEASEPITVEGMRERLASTPANSDDVLRVLAETADGHAVGYGHLVRHSWLEPGVYWMHITVDPAARRRHVGTQTYAHLLDFGAQHGAQTLRGAVGDHLPGSLAFAEHLGFHIERHIFESTLDLATFDESRFASVVDTVRASGVRFFTMADAGDTPEARRKLYELERTTARDIPGGSESSIRPFEAFVQQVCESPRYRPEAQQIAADGEAWVGCAECEYEAGGNFAYNGITGVLPSYRGQHIALALKLLAIRWARAQSIRYLRTNNDSENAPMLAVNRNLGYRPEPGYYRVLATIPA